MKVATIVILCGYQLPNKTQLARVMYLRLFKIIVTLERNNNKQKKTIIMT